MLLSRGNVVYRGVAAEILPYFAAQGYDAPAESNPLDFVIDISSIDNRSSAAELESKERVGQLVVAWREKETAMASGPPGRLSLSAKGSQEGDVEKNGWSQQPTRATAADGDSPETASDELGRANLFRQTAILTRRGLRNVFRNYGQLVGFTLQSVMCVGSIFHQFAQS